MSRLRIMLVLCAWSLCMLPALAKTYYVHSKCGNDNNSGTKKRTPFRTLDKVNSLDLMPGDEVLLANGCTFQGALELMNQSGTAKRPIIISAYPSDASDKKQRPIIDANGFLVGILVKNCSHVRINNLEISANGGGARKYDKQKKYMRCGVLVTTSSPGNYKNIKLHNLLVRNVYFENDGFQRGQNEVKTANGSQNYGWGIRFINQTQGAILSGLTVESCEIRNVAHTGLKFTGNDKSIHTIKVYNNRVTETGGPGIQMSGVHQGHVKGNTILRSGSNTDSRKWGRGSGLWTWGTSNVIIEHNSFKNANGPGDSAGCHIDYNCSNVIVQYNLSANNAGGFCEILGNNHNCAYRYNISVNDGHRIKGRNGAFQEGKIVWLSGYQGQKKRSGPFNSYIYNNTIYVNKEIEAKIAVDKVSAGVLMANNIFCITGKSKAVLGDQYKPEKEGQSQVNDIVFQNNLYLLEENWPADVLIQDEQPIWGDPQFVKAGGTELENYQPLNTELTRDNGIVIQPLPNDSIGLFIGLEVGQDILGNPIKGLPDMGAIELE